MSYECRGKCNGIWTRELGKDKSIINYILIKKADVECYEKLEIDKDRIRAPHTINFIEKQLILYTLTII